MNAQGVRKDLWQGCRVPGWAISGVGGGGGGGGGGMSQGVVVVVVVVVVVTCAYVAVGGNFDSNSRISHRGGEVGAGPLAVCRPSCDISQSTSLKYAGTRHCHVPAEQRERERDRGVRQSARERVGGAQVSVGERELEERSEEGAHAFGCG